MVIICLYEEYVFEDEDSFYEDCDYEDYDYDGGYYEE